MRLCATYRCKKSHGGCCADCLEQDCPERCLNAPDRCRCWVEGPPRQQYQRGPAVDVDRIVALGRTGMLYAEIAKVVGCTTATVQKHLNAAGIRRYNKGGKSHE